MLSFMRIYTGSPVPSNTTVYEGYNVGLTEGGTWTGNGITSSVAPYRLLNTLVVRIPKNVYYENESDFSLVYNSEWSYWNITTDETGNQIGGLKYSQYKKRGLNGKNAIVLSYKKPQTNDYGESYTFASPENFEWKSNNTAIATVENVVEDGVMMAVVIPTGIPGTVTFTLTCNNGGGDHKIEIKSLALTVVEDSTVAYLRIPETLSPVIVRKNAAANIPFASNLQQFNEIYGSQTETVFTLKLYDAELSDGKLVKTSNTPVCTTKKTATASEPLTAIPIAENILSKVSPTGTESYIAEVSADFYTDTDDHKVLPEKNTDGHISDGHFSAEVSVKVKNYPVRVSLSATGNGYLLGGQDITASWTLENADDSYDWKYYIADENGTILSEYKNAGSGVFDKKSLTFTAPEVNDVLKHTYTLTVAASNDVNEEGWSIAVKTFYVYNKDALDILVQSVKDKVKVSADGDTVTMDSREWLKQYLSDDGKTIKLGSEKGISFGSLQTDTHIDTLISLNYGEYEWGLISDAIEWKVTPAEGSADAVDFYYEKMGVFSDTETSGLTSYLPTKDFRLIAVRDGKVTVTATHAMSKISSSVEVNVDVLDNELVLFQFYPAVKTEVTYTVGGKDVTVSSDDNGQLALYEAAKLDNDTRFYLKSVSGESDYVGMATMSELKSGERNALDGRTYPVNLIKLQKPAEIHLYFNDDKGAALKNKTFTVRGGVFYDGEYAEHADLFDSTNKNDGNIAGDRSSGLDDLTYTTDDNGMIAVYFNMEQFTASGEVDSAKKLQYVFEVKLDGYQPEIISVNPYEESNVVTTLTSVTDAEKDLPYIWDFNVGSWAGVNFQEYLMLDGASKKIGPNYKQSAVTLEANTALWGLDDLLTVGSSETGVSTLKTDLGYQYYTDEGTSVIAGDGATKNAQKYEFWLYPFSSFAFCYTELRADAYDTSLLWLEEKTEHPIDITLFDDKDEAVTTIKLDYELYKNMDSKEVVESEELKRQMEEQQKQIKEVTKDFGLGDLVPGGDILATGLTFLTSAASGGNYGVHFKVTPTADPAVYYILVSLSDEEPEDDDEEEKPYELKPEYEDIQNLGKEAISGIMGTHEKNYASKNKGLAATLKKESEDIYKVGDKKKEEKKKDDDDDDDDDNFPVKFGGSILTRATYDTKTKDWSLSVCGGSVHLKWDICDWDYHKNILVVYVPVTVSIGIKLNIKGEFEAKTIPSEDAYHTDKDMMRMSATLKAEFEAFAGVGVDVSVIAIKIGFFGKFEPTATAEMLKNGYEKYYGANINLKGELGMKFVFKALVVNFEYTLCSFLKFDDEGKDFNFGSYETIEKLWKGDGKTGGTYAASVSPSGEISYTIEKARAVPALLAPATTPGSSLFKTYQKGEGLENVIMSDDGKNIFYLDDGVAFWADKDGTVIGPIASGETNDYGQFYLDAAGDGSAAVWVTQTAANKFDDPEAPTAAELAAVMNSSEITAAIYDGKKWTTTRLTSNTAPDLAPSVSVSADGYYVLVAWRSLYNSDPNDPLNFDVDDNIMYRIYNKHTGKWSDPAIAYNGIANGSVYALDCAVFSNGNALIGYTVSSDIGKVDESKNESGLETFYTFLKNTTSGMENTTVRVTDNRYIDANAQIHKIWDGGKEYAVLGWYSGEDTGDICLRVIDADGKIDASYPSSIAEVSDVRVGNNFRMAGLSKDGLVIGWTNLKDKAEGEIVASGELCATRIYCTDDGTDDGSYRAAPVQTLTSTSSACPIDDFTLYESWGTVTAVLSESDYSAGDTEVTEVFSVDDYIRPSMYATDADYQAARTAFMKEYPKGLEVVTPVGYYKAEKVSAKFKNILTVTDVSWNQDTVAPGLTVPVQFTVRNDGYTEIDNVSIGDIVYKFNKYNYTEKCSANVKLQPGESTTITADFTMNASAGDVKYRVYVPDDNSFEETEDFLLFNTPEVAILDAKQIAAANGKRSLSIRLGNQNMVPSQGAWREYHIYVYKDAECENLLAEKVLELPTLLDENAETVIFEDIDVSKIMDSVGMSGMEIPGSGFPLYIKVDTEGFYNSGKQHETDTDLGVVASTSDVVFVTTLCKDPQDPLVIDCPDFTVEDNAVKGTYAITNTSLYNKDISKYAVVARDADGLVTAMQLLSTAYVNKESTLNGEYSFTFSDTTAVASVTVEAISEAALPTLTEDTHEFGGWYTTDTFGTAAASDARIGYAKWIIGRDITVSTSIEHGTVTTDLANAIEGAVVTVNAKPDKGYALDTITVTDAGGNSVTVSADNTFEMPAAAVTVTATFKREAYNTASLNLADAIGLWMRIDTDFYGADPDTGYVKLTYDHAKGAETDIQTDKILLSEATKETDGRYLFVVNLAPAEITEKIKIELYVNDTAKDAALTQEYSIADYCETVEATMPELAGLSKALRVYGSACQVMFGVNTDNLAESDYARIAAGYNADKIGNSSVTNGATGIKVKSVSLEVQEKTTVRHSLTLAEGATIEDYTVTLTASNSKTTASAQLIRNSVSGKFYVEVSGIEAPNLSMTYTLTITNRNDGTKTEIKDFCVLNYAKAVLEADLGSGIENLVRGLCMYNLMADAYFNK